MQDWKFPQLVEALENWTCRNYKFLNHKPLSEDNRANPYRNPNEIYQANQYQIECVYSKKSDHWSDCQIVKTISERRKLFSEKKLCFNCTEPKHRAADCRSWKTCLICKKKQHTSISDKSSSTSIEPLLTTTENNVIYPAATVKINRVKCCALLDTGSGSSYTLEGLLNCLKINPTRKEIKTIKTLTNLNTKKIKIYSVKMQDVDEKYSFNTELNKLEREVSLTLPIPKYSKTLKNYPHIREVRINDTDEKEQLPLHFVLMASDFAKIKIVKSPGVGKIGEPFAKLTKIGWVMMSPSRESDVVSAIYTQTSASDYEKLCSTDNLGVKKSHYNCDEFVFEKFKKELNRSKEGWYETGLIWRENKIPLGNNKCESLDQLKCLLKNLDQKQEEREAYDSVIEDRLENSIIEEVTDTEINSSSNEFYMPHRAVIRESAESKKLRVVYDASVKSESEFSLNH